mmetsp:Transcript_10260/g.14729  ORF Transcript_10260/g.14729 Transcript_10260/m.14729 type:complete len:128 (-) Transcript_10260:397-780(-)
MSSIVTPVPLLIHRCRDDVYDADDDSFFASVEHLLEGETHRVHDSTSINSAMLTDYAPHSTTVAELQTFGLDNFSHVSLLQNFQASVLDSLRLSFKHYIPDSFVPILWNTIRERGLPLSPSRICFFL